MKNSLLISKDNPIQSFFGKLFGLVNRSSFDALQVENQELILMNQRNMETIKILSEKLAQNIDFQQNIVRNIEANLKIVENIPQSQAILQQNIQDSFERATFYIQNTCQDLLHAKSNLVSIQSDVLDSLGALEIAEHMRSFLVNSLFAKQIKIILHAINIPEQAYELESAFQKLFVNSQIILSQMEQLNFKLEKYNLRIEESFWKPYSPDFQTSEKTDFCDSQVFSSLLKFSQQFNFPDLNEKTKSIVIGEVSPTISYFNKDKGCWTAKRRGKVLILKSSH